MIRAKTVAFSKNSTNIIFHILTECNLKCRHCYINPGQHRKNTLPLSVINTWLEAFTQDSHSKNLIFLFVFPNGRVYRCPLCEDFALQSLFF